MTQPEDEVALAEALGRLLAGRHGLGPRVRIDSLRRLSGGASRETWSFVARADDDPIGADGAGRGADGNRSTGEGRPLILQRVRPGLSMGGPSLRTEDRLLAAAARAGVPVPTVVVDAVAARPVLGEARVTAHVDGETLGPRIVRGEGHGHAREVLAGQCARALAAIHALDPAPFAGHGTAGAALDTVASDDTIGPDGTGGGDDTAGLTQVDTLGRIREGLDLLDEARPAFELALRWLHDNHPDPGPVTVVHGDFRMGNLIVDDQGLAAVLDWELAHLGDPREDLGWLCVRAWRFGGDGEVGGFAPLEDLLDAYAEATGAAVDAEAVRWWIVAGTLTWGLICAVQAHRHLDGHVRSVELATIGRRVCETEYDLLDLLDVTAPLAPVAAGADSSRSVAATASSLHGRPTAAELVDAVRSHLVEQVAPSLDGSAAFALKVASNALAIVQRELELGPQMETAAAAGLAALDVGLADEASLAAGIRAGTVDGGRPDVAATVRRLVADRLRVANPKWLRPADRTDLDDMA